MSEEAAFCFARFDPDKGFEYQEWSQVPAQEFAYRSLYHIELTDACRARVIKRAHELQCSLIEFHSHPLAVHAQFSLSDRSGLSEFVPHVWWRLKGRPYAAVVVGARNFDSLVWTKNPNCPNGVLRIVTEREAISPSGLSFVPSEDSSEWQPI